MSRSCDQTQPSSKPLELGRWGWGLGALTLAGAVVALAGGLSQPTRLGFAYLTAYLFFLSLCVGGLFWVMVQHLMEASWSVPLRRVAEHLGGLAPMLGLLWLPLAALAPGVYPWMQAAPDAEPGLEAKASLLNRPVWYGLSVGILALWSLLGWRLRAVSLQQDRTGAAACTHRLRVLSAVGMCGLAVTLTLAAVLWGMSLQPSWCSAVYGVSYFAGSAWVTVAALYGLAVVLKRAGPLAQVLGWRQFHDLGVLWFAFTMVYAYIHFVQYFVIWNGNIPEHTLWYAPRTQGRWAWLGLALIVGHFLVPFLALLRRDTKLNWAVGVPLAVWCGLMHYLDVAFHVLPAIPPEHGAHFQAVDLGCMAFMAGGLALAWVKAFNAHAPFPLRDPLLQVAPGLSQPEVPARFATGTLPQP